MQSNRITSRHNPQVMDVVHLRDKKSYRNKRQAFVVEGLRELSRAFKAGWHLERLFFCDSLFKTDATNDFLKSIQEAGLPVLSVSSFVFNKMTQRQGPDGILGVVRMKEALTLDKLTLSVCPLLLVAQSIEKPGNLGNLIRTVEGAGVDALILCNALADLYNPNTIRNAQGALFTQHVVACTKDELIGFCKVNDICLLATTPEAAQAYFDISMRGPTALIVGNEHEGLSEAFLAEANHCVHIPMAGSSDSLNVNTAAAIILYEAVRQRAQQS